MTPEKFVVVENVGTDTETVVFQNSDTVKVYNFMDRNYLKEEIDSLKVNIMLQREDGTLTTEY